MKVSDLKMELKRRNLPVSGSKPQLIERLKFYTHTFTSPPDRLTVATISNSAKYTAADTKVSSNSSDTTDGASKIDALNNGSGGSNKEKPRDSRVNWISDVTDLKKERIREESNERSSDFTNEVSSAVFGLFESGHSPRIDHPSVSFSSVSSRIQSASPMEVDFDVSDLKAPETPLPTPFEGREGDSINTPPPPPPPPPVSLPCLSPAPSVSFGVSPRLHMQDLEGIDHLKKKIQELQRELLSTQRRLVEEQKQNMLKTKETSKTVISDNTSNSKISNNNNNNIRYQGAFEIAAQKNLLNYERNLAIHHLHNTSVDDLILVHHGQNKEGSSLDRNSSRRSDKETLSNIYLKGNQPSIKHEELISVSRSGESCVNSSPTLRVGKFQVKLENTPNDQQPSSLCRKSQRSDSMIISNGVAVSSHHRASSLPDFSDHAFKLRENSIIEKNCITREGKLLHIRDHESKKISDKVVLHQTSNIRPPPDYSEAMKQSRVMEPQDKKNYLQTSNKTYKSPQVDDVLDILIKNGELPPHAAQEPITLPQRESKAPLMFSLTTSTNSSSVIPPPPPPPPSSQRSTLISAIPEISASSNNTLSSLFADLVTESSNSNNLALHLDLGLPMLEEMEFSFMGSATAPSTSGEPVKDDVFKTPTSDVKMEFAEDVDVASWLDSLANSSPALRHSMPPSTSNSSLPLLVNNNINPISARSFDPNFLFKSTDSRTSSGVSSMRSSLSCASSSCGLSHNQCDPLLGSNPDQMDFFSMEDVEMNSSQITSDLSWDFPTS